MLEMRNCTSQLRSHPKKPQADPPRVEAMARGYGLKAAGSNNPYPVFCLDKAGCFWLRLVTESEITWSSPCGRLD
ncbi:hypothetical protein NXS19_013711 [Fusarium pseudograminearum]|nr:hypothetical protein NXS19_013711 [Fusarium pseudograminearum]